MKRSAWLPFCRHDGVRRPRAGSARLPLRFTPGFDYVVQETPGSPIPTPFLATGDEYRAVGFCDVVLDDVQRRRRRRRAPIALTGATASSSSFVGGVLEVVFDPHARFRIYEDAANNGDYGTNSAERHVAEHVHGRHAVRRRRQLACARVRLQRQLGQLRRHGDARRRLGPSGSSRRRAAPAGCSVAAGRPNGSVDPRGLREPDQRRDVDSERRARRP